MYVFLCVNFTEQQYEWIVWMLLVLSGFAELWSPTAAARVNKCFPEEKEQSARD